MAELTRDLGLELDNMAGLSSSVVVVFAMVREAALPRGLQPGFAGLADLLSSSLVFIVGGDVADPSM